MTKLIPLTRGAFSIVNDEDFDFLMQWKWNVTKQGYAIRLEGNKPNRRRVGIHQKLMNPPAGMVVDHINGNKLDNRKENIRICTKAQNSWNQGKRGKGPYKGVSWQKNSSKWIAQICVHGKGIFLGRFRCPVEAAKVYNVAAMKYHGEFAYLNPV